MEEELFQLKKKIKLLEEQLEDRNILIELLLNDIKKRKNQEIYDSSKRNKINENSNFETKSFNNKSNSIHNLQNENSTNNLQIKDYSVCASKNIENKNLENVKSEISITNDVIDDKNYISKYKLKDDLDNMFNKKKVTKIFRDNVFIDEFVDYCGDVFLIKSFDEFFVNSISKNLKKYLSENKQKIYKFLILNINKLPLNIICSTMILLSSEFSEYDKLIMIHDIILYVNIHSKILFIVFCLINSPDFFQNHQEDILKDTVYNILCFQYLIDVDLHKNKKISTNFTTVKTKLGLDTHKVLEDYILNISTDLPILESLKFSDKMYKYIYAVRVLGHFLDWDYIFNVYIIEKLMIEINPCKMIYLGILALNSLRLFGRIESNIIIFDFIKSFMRGSDEISIASYLIYKQVDEKNSFEYISNNENKLKEIGFDIEYLKKFILF